MRLKMFERVFIDSCNVCNMETNESLNPDHLVACTMMYCGEQFDRIYHENEVEYIENFGWRPIDFNI